MNTVQRVAKNALALYIGQILVILLSLALSVYLARELGSVVLGKYAFAGSFTTIFAVFIDLGFNTVIVREVARNKSQASKYLRNLIAIRIVLSAIIFVSLAITINLMDYPSDTTLAVYILGISIIFNALSGVFIQTFIAFERMEYDSLISVGSQILTVCLAMLAIFLGYGLIGVVSAVAIGNLVKFTTSFFICRKKFAIPGIEVDLTFWKTAAKSALPLWFIPLAATICIRTDTVMLSIMKGDAVVGWYNAANTMPLGFTNIPWIFMTALLPLMSASFVSQQSSLRTIYEKSSKFLVLLGLPMTVGMCLLADRIIMLLYGTEFQPSVSGLQILSWRLFQAFLGQSILFTLIAMNKERQMALIVLISAMINVLLNFLLIPPLGLKGAAMTTLITGGITLILYLHLVSKYMGVVSIHKMVVRPLIASAVMGVFVYWGTAINLFLLIGVAAALYFLTLYLIGTFTQEDKNMIRDALWLPASRVLLRR